MKLAFQVCQSISNQKWSPIQIILGANVLVVSRHGLSRGPALCVAYLMAKCKHTLASAWAKLREVRSWIKPSRSMVSQLKWFDALGCSLHTLSPLHSRYRLLNFAYHYRNQSLLTTDSLFTATATPSCTAPSSSSSSSLTSPSSTENFYCVCCHEPLFERKLILHHSHVSTPLETRLHRQRGNNFFR